MDQMSMNPQAHYNKTKLYFSSVNPSTMVENLFHLSTLITKNRGINFMKSIIVE